MRRALFAAMVVGLLLMGCWKMAAVSAASSQEKITADKTGQQAQSSSTNYVGNDTCMTCHSDVAKDAITPRAQTAFTHSAGQTCESCHGPGKAHVDSGGDSTKIFRFTTASEKQVNTTCLQCHAAVHPNFAHSEHAKAGLSCINCHSTHRFKEEENHLKVLAAANLRDVSCGCEDGLCATFPSQSARGTGEVHRLPRSPWVVPEQSASRNGRLQRNLHQVPHGNSRAVRLRTSRG